MIATQHDYNLKARLASNMAYRVCWMAKLSSPSFALFRVPAFCSALSAFLSFFGFLGGRPRLGLSS